MKKKVQVTLINLPVITGEVRLWRGLPKDFLLLVAQAVGKAIGIDPECIGVNFGGEMNTRDSFFNQTPVFSVQCQRVSDVSQNRDSGDTKIEMIDAHDLEGRVEQAVISFIKNLSQGDDVFDLEVARRKRIIAMVGRLWTGLATAFFTTRTPQQR